MKINAESPGLLTADLACGYRRTGRVVLSGVSLSIPRGRFACVIGPNGAGKTTLLRTLAGLLPSLHGDIRIAGEQLTSMHATQRARRLSVVLTDIAAPGYLTVEQFVALGRHPYTGMLARMTPDDEREVSHALEQTGTTHLRRRFMSKISDGERQRASVARALTQAADVMVLDEPTAFLDIAARASLMTGLRRIAHTTDRIVVASSHDVELVLRTADLLAIIEADGSLAVGSPEDLALTGKLESLFVDRSLRFDAETGAFRLPRPIGTPVRIVGSGREAHWTAHAIERIGHPVLSGSSAASDDEELPTVTVPRVGGATWRLRIGGQEWDAETIERLTELLRD
ncbi:MAG: ABC transporter ATP-binding protein [Spirochaetota bacterium]